ncbi:MAG: ATP-binding protein [Leptospirales bacterium]|jgi:chemotaxis family two-component system sensor kinase Cph1
MDFFARLFSSSNFMPHGHCYMWLPEVLWLHVVSDLIIGLSYLSIPFALVYFVVKRKDLRLRWPLWLFALFIVACGVNHFMNILVLWTPVYRVEGLLKGVTGVLSIGTAALLWPLIPQLLALPSPAQLEESNEKLESANQNLSASNAELEKFAYVASHDLKEPLRTVGSFVDLLVKRYKGKLDERADEYIQFMQDGIARMSALIEDLLAYSRLQRGANPFKRVDLHQVFHNIADDLRSSIESSGACLRVQQMRAVHGDSNLLRVLFQNIVSNAIKFRGSEPPLIEIRCEDVDDGDQVLVQVKDNGIGMDEGYADRVFEIFQRLHGLGEFEGTGIGLASCKKIAQLHGGQIWYKANDGPGTTFFVRLPAGRDARYETARPKRDAAGVSSPAADA